MVSEHLPKQRLSYSPKKEEEKQSRLIFQDIFFSYFQSYFQLQPYSRGVTMAGSSAYVADFDFYTRSTSWHNPQGICLLPGSNQVNV